jgi:ABC-type hemin transport system ATPase subunit
VGEVPAFLGPNGAGKTTTIRGVLTGSVRTQLPKLLGAAIAQLPAAIVLPAVAVLLFGLLPWESTALAWTAVALVGERDKVGEATRRALRGPEAGEGRGTSGGSRRRAGR